MSFDTASLPSNVLALQQMVIEYQKKQAEKDILLKHYKEQLILLRNKLFGSKSEKNPKFNKDQLYFFDVNEEVKESETPPEKVVTIKEHSRKKKTKKSITDDLPRVEIIHDLDEEEKVHSCGKKMHECGEEITEKLKIIPEKMIVEKHIRKKYACECEGLDTEGKEGAIKIAELPPQIIPKSIATPSLLAYIFIAKFCDALPFYRQTKIFARRGVDISRQNMSFWAMKIHERYGFLQTMMENDIRGGPLIGMDETIVQVLNEYDRKNKTKSYMWVCRGENSGKKIIVFNYFPERSYAFIEGFVKSYDGYLQSDAYNAYLKAEKKLKIISVGCWAHARRKFMDVISTSPNNETACKALYFINKLYKIERECKKLDYNVDQILNARQKKSLKILKSFKKWLDENIHSVAPQSILGKALNYVYSEWDRLVRYTEKGYIPIDNNLVENSIRPFVIGRKNWLFSGSPEGASASAFLYSLIETAKINGIDPYWYFMYIFEKLPYAKSEEDFRKLLPYNVDESELATYFVPARMG